MEYLQIAGLHVSPKLYFLCSNIENTEPFIFLLLCLIDAFKTLISYRDSDFFLSILGCDISCEKYSFLSLWNFILLRYFSSQGSSRGKEIGPTTDDAEKFDLESGSIKALSENFGSFPNCKRVRLSLTDNSDAESMNSQMYEDSRMQKQDVFASPNVDDSGVYKIVDRRSLSTFENQNTESTEKHSDAFISYEIGHRRQHCPKEDQESSNPVTFDCSAEPMPFLSQASSSVASIENKAGSNSLSLEKLSGRLSLFKYRKPVITNYLQKEKENQEIGACSQKKVDEETVGYFSICHV